MSEVKPPVTFCQLIRDQRIEVPLIQRDYAQGREAQKDVRDDFLRTLHDDALSLRAGDTRLPLNLDFVYGSMEAGDAPLFLPLDGQQRLTTLFLLHWYLAWRDERLPEFKALVADEKGSRFTYKVRPSSTEFFNELVGFVPASSPDKVQSVRRLLEDQDWFFLNWRSDPTIQAVLTMLDAIHARFRGKPGLYARLVDEKQPAITFHLLPLEDFGLSDDLYIKMNARGKPLTGFETFKARFEELLRKFPNKPRKLGSEEVSAATFFERRMDIQWTDFFWSHQNGPFDEAAMNLIWALIRVSLDPASEDFAADTTALGERTLDAGFTLFHDKEWLTPRFADHLMDLLEAWSPVADHLTPQLPGTNHFDEAAFFRRAIAAPWNLKYLELTQFAALVLYLTHYRGAVQKTEIQEWMRVITNLAANSDIERPQEFERCLAGLHKMVPQGNRILEWLAGTEIEALGFSPQQVREEVLKAKLIRSRAGWRERIDEAEAHGYFRGQIEFLLKFSGVLDRWLNDKSVAWSDADDAEYQRKFSDYFAKASAVFSADGLRDFGACRWERALLMKGDYLLSRGINWCFLDNGERDANWRRLLRGSFRMDATTEEKRQHLRALFDEINVAKGVKESLDDVLAKPMPSEPWQRAVIERPEIIEYCWGRKARWHDDGNIYLLRRIRTSGEHAELFTYYLKTGLLTQKHLNGGLTPFGGPQYHSVSGESETPHAYLEWKRVADTIALKFKNDQDSYRLEMLNRGGQLPSDLLNELVSKAGFKVGESGAVFRVVEKAAIESAIDEIVNVVRLLAAEVKCKDGDTGASK
jgi:hypothetical protein